MAVLLYNMRFSNNIPFTFAPGNNIMASALRRFFGGSIPPIIYAPYDVLLIIIFPLFPPSVIIRL